ncbi:MAG: NusG domain II-containing protein [Nitrospirae bacterium]|nr:NusG domain II-containing protein [Nitrospirota bacterium]
MNLHQIVRNTTKADRILILFLIIFCFSLIIFFNRIFSNKPSIHIYSEGKEVYILSLNENNQVNIKGRLGITTIEIKDKKVRFISSPCKNKLCIKQGWKDSGSIICLPNNVIVSIGEYRKGGIEIDAITK